MKKMIKNFIIFIYFFISNFRPTFSMNANFFPEKMKAYGGVVKPPGFYKIVLRDRWRSVQSALCADVFEYVMRDIIQKDNAVVYIKMGFFNYEAESNLEEFSECFEHFYTTQTNVDGEFEIQLPNSIQETIYIHMFPLDKNKKLIHSSSEPKFFLQNVMKKTNWKNCNEEFYLAFYHFADRDFKISKLLSRWVSLSQNAKLSDEEAFLLKAYLRDVTEKLVKFFTNGLEMKTRELNILFNYGNSLLKCQSEGKLEKTLAQIDGMQMLVKNFCMFLRTEIVTNKKSGKIEEQNMQQFNSLIELRLSVWRNFCEKNLEKLPENSKMLVNLANVGTASKELPKTDKTHFKKVQKATGGTGVFHSVLLPHLRNID